jgi:hypothetical protein
MSPITFDVVGEGHRLAVKGVAALHAINDDGDKLGEALTGKI